MNPEFRFSGISRLYGVDALPKLSKAHAMVIGLGGVGSWTVEALARSGVGTISLVDLDEVCESNINRQVLALGSSIGKLKTETLKERIHDINPSCQVHVVSDFLTNDSIDEILALNPDIVVDAIDSMKNKILLAVHCQKSQKPLICVGAAGGKTDPSKIRISDLSETKNDALLSQMRKSLRQKHQFPRTKKFKIPAVYSEELARQNQTPVCDAKDSTKLDCSTGLGSISPVTGTFGLFAAHICIETIITNT